MAGIRRVERIRQVGGVFVIYLSSCSFCSCRNFPYISYVFVLSAQDVFALSEVLYTMSFFLFFLLKSEVSLYYDMPRVLEAFLQYRPVRHLLLLALGVLLVLSAYVISRKASRSSPTITRNHDTLPRRPIPAKCLK